MNKVARENKGEIQPLCEMYLNATCTNLFMFFASLLACYSLCHIMFDIYNNDCYVTVCWYCMLISEQIFLSTGSLAGAVFVH